ncbi:MAG: hypothetical protein H7240_01660 [Glaciimonas sp.]|nr:hypothetical protein [Glaciimonas sp.]
MIGSEQARYGQFRVAPDGQVLLVGLQDVQLNVIQPLAKTLIKTAKKAAEPSPN